jgi:large subunit ribosomal protein L15
MLNQIRDNDGARLKFKRVGRGEGSGKGKTCGRGVKGQKARSGVSIAGFEGGQNPLYMRLPKRGFKNIFRQEVTCVNLGSIQDAITSKKIDPSEPLDLTVLKRVGLVRANSKCIKILGVGELSVAIQVTADAASATARAAIEKAKGTLTLKASA